MSMFEFPSLPVQRRIAGILSAYDDLIENNQRRIKILEEMARSLYREWFVNFRFPGHEKVPLVDSPLGADPTRLGGEAWSLSRSRFPACAYAFTKRTELLGGGTIHGSAKDLTALDYMFMDDSPEHITDRRPR